MKLFLNKTSPYARMIRILLLEKDLTDEVEFCWCDPWNDDKQLIAENPAGKIPTLITDSGIPISESLLIACYLETLASKQKLIPQHRQESVFHLCGLAQGLMDAAFTTVVSKKHLSAEAENSVLAQRRLRAILRTLNRLEHSIENLSIKNELTIGDIATAVALEYLLFRLPELYSGSEYPKIESWLADISQSSSFISTRFSYTHWNWRCR